MSSIIIATFTSYGHFYQTFQTSISEENLIYMDIILLNLWVGFVILLLLFFFRTNRDFNKTKAILTIIPSLLIFISISKIGLYAYKNHELYEWHYSPQAKSIPSIEPKQSADSPMPDIYYLIFDAYARDDVLKKYYNFDNTPFLSLLEEKGFYIARDSRSNYTQTCLSVSSSLNMTYLSTLADQLGTNTNYVLPLNQMIKKNLLFEFLTQHNYKTISFATGYYPTEIHNADYYFSPSWVPDDFQNVLLERTPLPSLKFMFDMPDRRYKVIAHTISQLKEIPNLDNGPHITFAHLSIPHAPFHFDQYGNERKIFERGYANLDTNSEERQKYIKGYIHQVKFVNSQIIEIVNCLLENSKTPPIIVIQSDHGPSSFLKWNNPDKMTYYERMAILSAFYLPDFDTQTISPSITPVNTFRIILNHYFQTDLDILEDRSYFSSKTEPYNFVDVSEYLDENSNGLASMEYVSLFRQIQ